MNMTTFTLILMLIAILISCDDTNQITRDVYQTDQPMDSTSGEIVIGVVLPQTGDLGPSEFGPGAQVMENGFNMALEEINQSQILGNKTLKFIIEDDMSTVDGAIAAFEKLIHQDKVPAILGVWTSHVAEQVFPIAQANGVVVFSPVVIKAGLTNGNFLFRACNTTETLIPGGVKKTQAALGYQRVATLWDKVDAFSIDSNAVFRRTLKKNGITILDMQSFETGKIDFSTQLLNILALEPEAIFLSSQQREAIHILTQAQDLGIPPDVPFISLVLSIDEIQRVGDAAEGSITFTDWAATADTPGNQEFVQSYTAKYGMEPSVWAAQSYAAVHIFAKALLNAQSTEATAIAKALSKIKGIDTILGEFSFNANGDAVYDPVVLIVKNGKLEVYEQYKRSSDRSIQTKKESN